MKKLTEKQFKEVTEKAEAKVSKEADRFLQENPKFNKKVFTTYKMMFSTKILWDLLR